MKKRIFISVDLPPKIKDYLKSLKRPEIRYIRWMNLDNLHITLNFLGDLDEQEIEAVKQIMQKTAQNYRRFELIFDQAQAMREMLWLTSKKSDDLIWLQKELKNAFKSAGIGKSERRPYSPHILLAKSEKRSRNIRLDKIKNFELKEFTVPVDQINLYESKLTPEAATHILIQSFPLAKSANF